MTKKLQLAILLLLGVCLIAFQPGKVKASVPADEDFVTNAAKGGKMEVDLGRLALKRARSLAVKRFGQRMVTDHTRAGNELKRLAMRKKIALPMAMDPEGHAEMDRLAKLRGAEFDRAYMDLMVSDHEKDVGEFQNEADNGADVDIKAFAARTLPTLKTHLSLARSTAAKVK
ncbi:MAG: putative rane protein [Pyrinomonadaceae bacterium]|jgi:putative membrane protein|nr:putative rane protein [Pyrinomonadaceae bacterium]